MTNQTLQWGRSVPWFYARSNSNPRFCFDSVAGRAVVLSFFRSAGDPYSQQMLAALEYLRPELDDYSAAFFGVSIDPQDEILGRTIDRTPGVRFFYDTDLAISQAFGVADARRPGASDYRCASFVLDERLRIFEIIPFGGDPETHVQRLRQALSALPALDAPQPARVQAPILVVPRIFEPELCRKLIGYYEQRGGRDSGFMRDIQGKTVEVTDYSYKRRRDAEILDETLRRDCMLRIHDRLAPEIKKAFQFDATRIERYIVACYEAESGGHFRAHRDNTTKGTAHRRFAVSLNLNTGEYAGGQLQFPEFGRQVYTPPAGGAVVFSCSLLHEATPVTSGKRYVFLPFLYDEAAARVRQENFKFIGKATA
jgi:peroxiredoxin